MKSFQEKLYKFESKARKKILHYETNPFMIYFCVIIIYSIIKPIDYLILNPIIISSSLIIFCIDNIELWARFTLRIVQYYALLLRKINECSFKLQDFVTNKTNDWRENIDQYIVESHLQNQQRSIKVSLLKLISIILEIFKLIIMIQLYFRVPIMITMNKINAFTIKIQQSEISLLRTKSHYLSQKNKWLTLHVSTMEKRRIKQYNMMISKRLHKYLKNKIPIELIQLIYSFSYKAIENDPIKMNLGTKQKLLLKAASKMNHIWIWKRYQFVTKHRNVNLFEKICWYFIYYWFMIKCKVLSSVKNRMNQFCGRHQVPRHTLKMICYQLMIFWLFFSKKRQFIAIFIVII